MRLESSELNSEIKREREESSINYKMMAKNGLVLAVVKISIACQMKDRRVDVIFQILRTKIITTTNFSIMARMEKSNMKSYRIAEAR